MTFAIAVYYDYHLKQMNIKTAFLNKILKEKVFITQFIEYINEIKCVNLTRLFMN